MPTDNKKTIVKTDMLLTTFEIKRNLYNDFHSLSFNIIIVDNIYEYVSAFKILY